MTYILYMLIDNEWYRYDKYHDVCTLAMASHQLGLEGVEQIKVVVI